jgi:hypothetical protein
MSPNVEVGPMFCRVATFVAAAAATAGIIAGSGIGAAPVGIADPSDINCTQFSEDGSCYYANCTQAKAHGECNIPAGSPHYCPKQDRDHDGVACEC